MEDYNDAFMRNQNSAVRGTAKGQNRANVLQLKLIGQSHPTGLTTNLLKLFEPRPPLEFKPLPEKRKCPPYSGMAQFVSNFAEPGDLEYAPPIKEAETRAQKKARIHMARLEKGAEKAVEELQKYDPNNDPNVSGDPYKTLFVARLNYETTESKIKRELESYGPIKQVRMVADKVSNKPRGYAFIEYMHTRDMKAAYKQADGRKLDGRRVLVDVERELGVKKLIRGILGERFSNQEDCLGLRSQGHKKIGTLKGKGRCLVTGEGTKKEKRRSHVSSPMIGQGIVTTEKIGIPEIVKERGTETRRENEAVTVIGHVIEVRTVAATMSVIERETVVVIVLETRERDYEVSDHYHGRSHDRDESKHGRDRHGERDYDHAEPEDDSGLYEQPEQGQKLPDAEDDQSYDHYEHRRSRKRYDHMDAQGDHGRSDLHPDTNRDDNHMEDDDYHYDRGTSESRGNQRLERSLSGDYDN
ncbi:hypothetical protein OIU77_019280 [Salix suchowensis]|uniref:RRM domain-containing protein n=1 Tax=Salix suchowensis TaxID=1278906 RepID=A0ABQ9CFE4_9ROSI|nr:hypothetical protein OIU77_019280 [Salix suchowensis]